MLNFDFLKWEKFLHHILCINWPNLVAWLPLLPEILVSMCIAIACFPGCGVIDFEINLMFLTKLFSYMIKKSRFKYLENQKSF